MKQKTIIRPLGATLLAFALGQTFAAAPERPLIPVAKAEEVTPLCDKGLADLRQRVVELEKKPLPKPGDAKKVFAEWNDLQIAIEDLQGPVEI